MEALVLEEEIGDDGEDDEGDALLDDLELNEGEGTAVAYETDAIGGHLTTVLEEGNHPREGDDKQEGPVGADAAVLQLEMAVPGEGHEDIAEDEEGDGVEDVHWKVTFENAGASIGQKSLSRSLKEATQPIMAALSVV